MMTGTEWVIEAYGCNPESLRSLDAVRNLFARMIADLDLHPVGQELWRQFPESMGVTGLYLLSESHLACHTFPEHGTLCLNLFCCRPRPEWNFSGHLLRLFEAQRVTVRRLDRPYVAFLAEAETGSTVMANRKTS